MTRSFNLFVFIESNIVKDDQDVKREKVAGRSLVYSKPHSGYYGLMKTHQDIDSRSLAMARAIVKKIDEDPEREGLEKARSVCRGWERRRPSAAVAEWLEILEKPWSEIRSILLDESERGKRLRQSSPFGSVLSNKERWQIYCRFQKHDPN